MNPVLALLGLGLPELIVIAVIIIVLLFLRRSSR